MFLNGIVNVLIGARNLLSFGYNTINLLHNIGFVGGCISSVLYHINTLYRNNGDDVLYLNLSSTFSFLKVENLQIYVTRKYIPLFLPFLTPVCVFASPVIFTKYINRYIIPLKNNIYKSIYIANEFRKRRTEIINFQRNRVPFIEKEPDYCPVCTENFSENDNALSCGHYIHKECIIRSGKTICPLCKSELFLNIEEFIRIKYPELL